MRFSVFLAIFAVASAVPLEGTGASADVAKVRADRADA